MPGVRYLTSTRILHVRPHPQAEGATPEGINAQAWAYCLIVVLLHPTLKFFPSLCPLAGAASVSEVLQSCGRAVRALDLNGEWAEGA